jgi:epoxide hydrolase 4
VWREAYERGGETRFFVRTYDPDATRRNRDPATGSFGETDPGERELALLLHGWPQDGTSWGHVAPLLHEAGFRVVCADLKGFGRSDAPKRGYDPATLSDEISQLIQALGATKAVLVGHDWGGAVGLSTAFRHPGRVRALVTASSPFRQIDLMAAWHIPLLNLPIAPQVAFKLAGGPLTRAAIRYSAVVQEPFTDEVLEQYSSSVRAAPTAWLAYYRRLSRAALLDWGVRRIRRRTTFLRPPDRPHRLRVPAAVIWGELDRVTPFHLAERVAHDLDAQLVAIAGVGHFVHEEAPQAFADAVLGLVGPGGAGDVAHTAT